MSCHAIIWDNLLFCCSLFLIFPLYTLVYQCVNEIFHVNKIFVACWFSHRMILHEHFSVSHNTKTIFSIYLTSFMWPSIYPILLNFFFLLFEIGNGDYSYVFIFVYLSLFFRIHS